MAHNIAQPFLKKLIHFYCGKEWTIILGYFSNFQRNLPNTNNYAIYENSPNLVTLALAEFLWQNICWRMEL
jgi:hypothetical protein